MGREKVQRHVTPVISLLRIELMNGEQFDDCNAELLQVGYFLD